MLISYTSLPIPAINYCEITEVHVAAFSICSCLAGLLKKPYCSTDCLGVAANDAIGRERGGAKPKVTFIFNV